MRVKNLQDLVRNGAIWFTVLWSFCAQTQSQTVVGTVPSQAFGSLAVNTATPAANVLSYTVSGSATPAFSLAFGSDFAIGSPKCTGTGSLTCTVSVNFLPRLPGLRTDAALVKSASGGVLATTLLYGTGLGPQISINPGIISTFAGTGLWSYNGDGGLATAAGFRSPQGIVLDNSGNLYVADSVNQVIRKINAASGVVTTLAGNAIPGYSGDGGLASKATLNNPVALALDGAGNLYIADQGNNAIREINAVTQQITTVAGGGGTSGQDGFGDGGVATNALLNGPSGIAVDGSGNLYIADSFHGLIRKVNASNGIITVLAGGGKAAGTDGLGDGGPATNAWFNTPLGVAVDANANVYVADSGNSLVRRIDSVSGVITAVAGNGRYGDTGDSGKAINAELGKPSGISLDPAGNIYIADLGENVIRQIDAASGIISTVAGSGAHRYSGDGGVPGSAGLANPTGVALDGIGNIYIADYANNVIRKVVRSTQPFTFPSTNVGQASSPQPLTILNIGNQPLSLSSLVFPSSFSQQSSGTVDCSASLVLAPGSACTVAIQFAPVAAGSATGSLTLGSNTLNRSASTQTATLSGSGVVSSVPHITLNPASVTFGNQVIGTKSPAATVSLSNTGSAPLALSSILLSGQNSSDFAITTTCQSVVAAGANCTLAITFSPAGLGARTGSLSLADNVASSPQSVALSGTGVGTPQATLSSTTLQFGSKGVGHTSATQTITLSNTGSGSLSISQIAISGGNVADFGMTTTCGSSLASAASCNISLTFAPKVLGLRMTTVTVTSNAAGSPQSAALKGKGAATSVPAVYAPTSGMWYVSPGSNTGGLKSVQWGIAGDIPIPGDYDGDGKVDVAVYRPSNGYWYIIPSSTSIPYFVQWGIPGDTPVPGDFDGDGKTDIAIFRASQGFWCVVPSSGSAPYCKTLGTSGDLPIAADYDGDGKFDFAVYRPSTGYWYIIPSGTSIPYSVQWGIAGDIPVPGDYDGDGKVDVAVYRPSGGDWYVIQSSTSSYTVAQWGIPGDMPITGDFDGDGKTDVAIWRPSSGTWCMTFSATATSGAFQLGVSGDVLITPAPSLQ